MSKILFSKVNTGGAPHNIMFTNVCCSQIAHKAAVLGGLLHARARLTSMAFVFTRE